MKHTPFSVLLTVALLLYGMLLALPAAILLLTGRLPWSCLLPIILLSG